MEIIFTPSSVLDLLTKIDELSEYDIGMTETFDNNIQLTIGESVYNLVPESDDSIEVSENVVSEVSEINQDTYESLSEDSNISVQYEEQTIESGLIKEAIKSLLLGGMIKLSSKLLKN